MSAAHFPAPAEPAYDASTTMIPEKHRMKLLTYDIGAGPRAGVLVHRQVHHSFGAMIERAAQDSRIVPGDVIATLTVGGGSISEAVRKGFPARWLQSGDVVAVEVEGIGSLRNTLGPSTNSNTRLRLTAPDQRPCPNHFQRINYRSGASAPLDHPCGAHAQVRRRL